MPTNYVRNTIAITVSLLLNWSVSCDAQNALEMLQDNTDGNVGLYLKRINGPVLANFRADQVFEPASAIKVLIHAHAMRQVQANPQVTLAQPVSWNADASKFTNGIYQVGGSDCYWDNNVAQSSSLQQSLRWMMENSDNALTQALRDTFGDNNIDATRAALGMSDSQLNHSIGCGGEILTNPNRLTLEDVGQLHEMVSGGYLNAPNRQTFYQLMTNSLPGNLGAIISNEAAKQGKAEFAGDFSSAVQVARKGGSYGTGGLSFRSDAGWMQLPTDFGVGTNEYVYGGFVDSATTLDLMNTGNSLSVSAAEAEMLRIAVRGSLLTWKTFGWKVPDIDDGIGKITDIKAQMPSSPIVPQLDRAVLSLQRAQDAMQLPISDFESAISEVQSAMEVLGTDEVRRHMADSFFDVITDLGGIAEERALDAIALTAAIGHRRDISPTLDRANALVENGRRLLESAAAGRTDYASAIEPFLNAVNATSPFLDFADGDLNYDGLVDVADIDKLTQGVLSDASSVRFDLDGNETVDHGDREFWVEKIAGTNFGDANLDGTFNSADLVLVFKHNEYEDGVAGNSTWAEGDWDGNGDFDTGDLVAAFKGGAYEQASGRQLATVPEPTPGIALCLWVVFVIKRRLQSEGR
ncbi:serine hydrolase [Planctomycetota bacterium]